MKNTEHITSHFGKRLLQWHERQNRRELPWKNTTDPYRIWLSEIMSQQTRIEHVIQYYHKFIDAFPTVNDMAASSEDKILSMWSGLGYYNRARNMFKTATLIVEKYDGVFPTEHDKIIALPGIGDYTAAAIVSFAYGDSYPVIDANVKRIYARLRTVAERLTLKDPRNRMITFLQSAMENKPAAEFNQAIMDFGAQICTSANPTCASCPLNDLCRAYETDSVKLFPVKKKRKKRRERMFHYIIVEFDGKLYLRKRGEKDIWRKMWEFPQLENIDDKLLDREELKDALAVYDVDNYHIREPSALYTQTLSHQKIQARFYPVKTTIKLLSEDVEAVEIDEIHRKAMPGIIRDYIADKYGDNEHKEAE